MRQPDYTRRVVVTGLGVISPVGNDKDTAWANLVNGRLRPREITKFDPPTLRPQVGRRGPRLRRHRRGWTPRPSAAASPPCGTASPPPSRRSRTPGLEITDENREDIGVVFGTGAGGQTLMIDNWEVLERQGPQPRRADVHRERPRRLDVRDDRHRDGRHRPQHLRRHRVLHRHQLRRRGAPRSSAAATSTRSSPAPREMPLLEVAHAGFGNMRGLGSPREGQPLTDVSRPFDRTRDGFVLGEGGGALILEDLELREGPRRAHLRRGRGLRLRRRRLGHGPADRAGLGLRPGDARRRSSGGACRPTRSTSSTRTAPRRRWATSARPRRSGRCSATGRPRRDRKPLAISATKSMTGHMMGAAGAFEAFATVMTVAEQCVPGTINYREFDPEADVWVFPETTPDASPLRAVEQHRPGRPQRRGHLQALGRPLTTVGQPPESRTCIGGGSLRREALLRRLLDLRSSPSPGTRSASPGWPSVRAMVLDHLVRGRPCPCRRARGPAPRSRLARLVRHRRPPRVASGRARPDGGRRATILAHGALRPPGPRTLALRYNPGDPASSPDRRPRKV